MEYLSFVMRTTIKTIRLRTEAYMAHHGALGLQWCDIFFAVQTLLANLFSAFGDYKIIHWKVVRLVSFEHVGYKCYLRQRPYVTHGFFTAPLLVLA